MNGELGDGNSPKLDAEAPGKTHRLTVRAADMPRQARCKQTIRLTDEPRPGIVPGR